MEKQNILLITDCLALCGVNKALKTALNSIDYDKNNVTLYARKEKEETDDFSQYDINIIVNHSKKTYKKNFYVFILWLFAGICRRIKLTNIAVNLTRKKFAYIRKRKCNREYTKYLRKHKFDITVCFSQGENSDLIQKVVSDKKYVFWYRGNYKSGAVTESVFDSVDGIITSSDKMMAVLSSFYPAYTSKVHVIENYIDVTEIKNKSEEYIVSSDSSIVLCTLGKLTSLKGFDIALKAAVLLADKGIDFEWYFIGNDNECDDLKKYIENNNLEERIIITGTIDNPYPYFKACDIYVQPSREDYLGYSIQEAQILCKPVISTKTLGALEHIANELTGIITSADERFIAAAIIKLSRDKDLRDRIVSNLEHKEYNNSEDSYKDNWKELFN